MQSPQASFISPVHSSAFSINILQREQLQLNPCVHFQSSDVQPQFAFALILCPVSCSEPGQSNFSKSPSYRHVTSSTLSLGPSGTGQEPGTGGSRGASS